MVLQAVIDDSGNEPTQNVYVLAGFIAPQERWAAFADEWQAALDAEPRLDFYKFTQSRALKGQFSDERGWTAELRDERVARLAQIITQHAIQRFEVSLRHEHFEKYVRSVPTFERGLLSDHPYLFLALHVVATVGTIATLEKWPDQVDFIYDEQLGFDVELMKLWPAHKDLSSPWGKPNIGQLFFHNEIQFLPLQAADMLAGSVRHGLMTNEVLPEATALLLHVPGMADHMDEADVRQFGARLLEEAERRVAAHPHVPLVEFDKTKARRQRKNTRRRQKPR